MSMKIFIENMATKDTPINVTKTNSKIQPTNALARGETGAHVSLVLVVVPLMSTD